MLSSLGSKCQRDSELTVDSHCHFISESLGVLWFGFHLRAAAGVEAEESEGKSLEQALEDEMDRFEQEHSRKRSAPAPATVSSHCDEQTGHGHGLD